MATKRRWDLFNPMGYDPPYYYDEDLPEEGEGRKLPKTFQGSLGTSVSSRRAKASLSKLDRLEARRSSQAARSNTKG